MYFFLILFFVSLAIIIFMIVRKLTLIKDEKEHTYDESFISEILDFDKVKNNTVKISKRTGHVLIWIIIRTYIISINSINKKKKEILKKIENKLNKNKKILENKEVSKYIKIIGEYRQKIKRLKHKIKEEEGID